MRIKFNTRLIIAFITITIIPLVACVALVIGLGALQINKIQEIYGISGVNYQSLSSSLQVFENLSDKFYNELKDEVKDSPEKLKDAHYLREFNQKLLNNNSYLVIRKGEVITYIGDHVKFETMDPEAFLIETAVLGKSASTLYMDGENPSLVKCIGFETSDEETATAYIVTEVGRMLPEMEDFLAGVILAIVLVLLMTGCGLVFWVRKGMMSPLDKMRVAAKNIKEGNLDFEIKVETDDELGELCRDFEEMRIRLKKNTEEKLAYDKESKELISNISHDLKTPITAIKGYAEGIIDGVADTKEKQDRYIRTIYNKANEMNTLINELTLYAKVDTNRIPYEFHTLLVDGYFDDCAEDLSLELESKGVEFAYQNYVEQDVKIIGDPEQIKRVIHNIVNNSLKYMDKERPYISIHLKDVGDFIQVEIEDNGKGIEGKDLPYVFDRFYRTDQSRNSSTGGSGIGLSIVKKIVEEHGGKIWATSRFGVGTVMHFVIRKYQEVPNE